MKEIDRQILEAERQLKELTAIKNGQTTDETETLLAELEDLMSEYDLNDKILFNIRTDTRLYRETLDYVPASVEIRTIESDIVLSKLDIRNLDSEEVLKRIRSYLNEYAPRCKLLVDLIDRFKFSKFNTRSKTLVIDLDVKTQIIVDFSTNNEDVFVSANRSLDSENNEMSFYVDNDLQLTFESADDRWPVLSKLKPSISTRPRLCNLDFDEIVDTINASNSRLDEIDIRQLHLFTDQTLNHSTKKGSNL